MQVDGVAIVTGAAGGIGKAIALQLCAFSCSKFVIVDIQSESLQGTKAAIEAVNSNARVLALRIDLAKGLEVCNSIVDSAVKKFGRVDYLVNCAGTPGGFNTSIQCSVEEFDRIQTLNTRATWLLQRAAVAQMLKQQPRHNERGSIVNIGSMVSTQAIPALSAYITSKHAVLGMTRAEALDSAAKGIRVNCVAPGLIDTNLGAAIPQEIQDRFLNPVIEKTPLGRRGTPEEVANVVVFLCSPLASYVTGASYAVDGGFTVG